MSLLAPASLHHAPPALPAINTTVEPALERRHRFTIDEYFQLHEAGLIGNKSELIDGEIVDMASAGNAHMVALGDLYDLLSVQFPKPWFIKSQGTVRFGTYFAPDPDLSLSPHRPKPWSKALDETPLLVVETATRR